jgi:hypothetical protein
MKDAGWKQKFDGFLSFSFVESLEARNIDEFLSLVLIY